MSKIKKYITEEYQELLLIVLVSMTITCMLLDIVQIFSINLFYTPYIIFIPILILAFLRFFCVQKSNIKLQKLYYSLGLSIIEYLVLIMFNILVFLPRIKITIYLVTVIYIMIYKEVTQNKEFLPYYENNNQENDKKIFSLYYINVEKVYEIAMLLNNKIITGGINENEIGSSVDKQTNIGINSNLSYLETIKGNINLSQSSQTHNSAKNKVLENFDVKTTKSNLLASIIAKTNEYKEEGLKVGDLILLKNVSLTLLNEEESYAVTKMILNGAFKDTKISSN